MSSASSAFDRIAPSSAAAGKVELREGLYSAEAAPAPGLGDVPPDVTAAAAGAGGQGGVSARLSESGVRTSGRVVGVSVVGGLVVAAVVVARRSR